MKQKYFPLCCNIHVVHINYVIAGCKWLTSCVHSVYAGYGGLSLSIEGPSKAEIQCKDNEDGTLNISYKPTEPGYYIVNLKFADHHVEGSPFTVKVCAS